MFTEKEIREAKCYGGEKHGIWIHAPTRIVHLDGTMSIANMDIQSYMGLIPPDDAVRILHERGVIVAEPAEPVAFKIGDRVEVVGPFRKDLELDEMIGRIGKIIYIDPHSKSNDVELGEEADQTFDSCNLRPAKAVDDKDPVCNFDPCNLRHAKNEAAPAQTDKWVHLPTDGRWTAWDNRAVWHYRPDGIGGDVYRDNGTIIQSHWFSVKTDIVKTERLITRAEAIAIFEENAAPETFADTVLHSAIEKRDERIAVLEQQLKDATAMALDFNDRLNKSSASLASCGDELYDERHRITELRGKVATTNKEISDLRERYDGLRLKLNATAESEAVMADDLATAKAAVEDLMDQVDERDATIGRLNSQLEFFRNHIESAREESKQHAIQSDQGFIRTAAMCMGNEYGFGAMCDNAPLIVEAAEILLAEIKKREAQTR